MITPRFLFAWLLPLGLTALLQAGLAAADGQPRPNQSPDEATLKLQPLSETVLEDLRDIVARLPREIRLALQAQEPRDGNRRQSPEEANQRQRGGEQGAQDPGPRRELDGRPDRQQDGPGAMPQPRFNPAERPRDRDVPRGPDMPRDQEFRRGPDMPGPDMRRGPDMPRDREMPRDRDVPRGPGMGSPGPDLLEIAVRDKLQFVERAMQAILEARQQAMDAKIAVVQSEAKMMAMKEIADMRAESVKQEALMRAKLEVQEIEAKAQQAIQQANQEIAAVRAEMEAMARRVAELEQENERLRQERTP